MRYLWAVCPLILLAAGCMQLQRPYPYSGQPFHEPARGGKTGTGKEAAPPRETAYAPAEKPPSESSAPASRGEQPPGPVGKPAPGAAEKKKKIRPKFEISLKFWIGQVLGGSVKRLPGMPDGTGDLMGDLSVKRETGITLQGNMDIFKGPRIRFEYSSLQAYTIDAEVNKETDISISSLEMGFTPVRGTYKWGSVGVDTGFRYSKWRTRFDWTSRPAGPDIHYSDTVEGLMATVAGVGDLRILKNLLALDARVGFGVGPDSGMGVLDTGVTVWPERPFFARFGVRLEGYYLFDARRSDSERRVRIGHHGIFLEMGFRF